MNAPGIVDESPVIDLFVRSCQQRMIEVAIRIGMLEALKEPADVSKLARELRIGERATSILLGVLASSGLVELKGGQAQLTQIARVYFMKESPFFKGALFVTIPDDELELMRQVHLADGFLRPTTRRWLAGTVIDPKMQAAIMHAHSFAAATVLAEVPVFSSVKTLLDVAGGQGSFSIALARRHLEMRCTVMDLPPMAAASADYARQHGVAGRVGFQCADMFTHTWRSGVDAVLVSNILHDWDMERCRHLARKAYDALKPGGHFVVNEMLMNEDRCGPFGVAMFSALMLLQTEGQQFTLSELRILLVDAGFEDVEKVAEFGYYSLVVGRKPVR